MIHSLTNDSLSRRCESCGNESKMGHDGLLAGIDVDRNIIALPACVCGAQEFLNRTHDNPGDHAHLVNSLHEHLVKAGKSHEAHKERLEGDAEYEKPMNRASLTSEPLVPPVPFDPVALLNEYLTDTPLT